MKAIIFLTILLGLASCASKNAEKEIEAKAAKEKTVTPQAFGNTIHDLIQASKTLTPAQKTELTDIFAANKKKADELIAESFKFRAVLIKELLSGNADLKKVEVIKKDIKNIEALRLKNTFDTVEKVSQIVGKHPNNNQFSDHLIHMETNLK